jgi:hypothetical protein
MKGVFGACDLDVGKPPEKESNRRSMPVYSQSTNANGRRNAAPVRLI